MFPPASPWKQIAPSVDPDRQYVAFVSRFYLKSYLRVPGFMHFGPRIMKKLDAAPVIIGWALAADIPDLIGQLFDRLSAQTHHGPVLVKHTLSYLGAARNGLTEDELLDVLALDEDVMLDARAKAKHELGKTLPAVIWSRLYFDLSPYLGERTADGTVLTLVWPFISRRPA